MIKEYALEPAVMADWENFRFFSSQFGCEKGRMISRFPSKWKKLVHELCKNNSKGITEGQLKAIESILFSFDNPFDTKFVKNSRDYDRNLDWVQNALNSNLQKPFHAIITGDSHQGTFLEDQIYELLEIWKVKTSVPVKRKAKEIVEYFKPFFELTNEIIFIEPHFDPGSPRYSNAFKVYFRELFSKDKTYKKIEIHTLNKIELSHFITEFKSKFKKVIKENCTVRIFQWERLENKENFHPRYLLTEVGGIRSDYGFDEGSENETTDIQILGEDIYKIRIKNIEPDTNIFELKAQILFQKKSKELTHTIIK